MLKFNDIKSRNELADFLKIPRSKLTYVLYVRKTKNLYSPFEIPKKNGGKRQIFAPAEDLKSIQRKLTSALWEYQKEIWKESGIHPNISHAFEKGKSIITNAEIHRNKRYVINLDLKDFFDTFNFGRVSGFFEKNKFFKLPHEVAVTIAQITCYAGHLPQGAPSSPIITNLICQIFDMRLLKIAKHYKTDYTRYADDLTFSTNDHNFGDHIDDFLKSIFNEIHNLGFSVNDQKTGIEFYNHKQKVTGLIVNKKLNVDRTFYKETRAMAHHLYTKGSFEINGKAGTINQLEGRFSFIDQLERYNNESDANAYSKRKSKQTHNYQNLSGREREYQAFLFYKYFYYNDKPLIITEGITDILYLKAALKNMYSEYPQLVEKTSNGQYKFKIAFLRRSKRLRYFFNIAIDGADAMKNLYNNLFGNKKNYLKYFRELCEQEMQNPVVLLFDNENKKSKPLHKFIETAGLKNEAKEALRIDLYYKMLPNDKVYLMTIPLIQDKEECEIEDLFTTATLSHKIGERKFSKDNDYDNKKYYGKESFSKFVYSNYKSIDFSKFKPLFDALITVAKQDET